MKTQKERREQIAAISTIILLSAISISCICALINALI